MKSLTHQVISKALLLLSLEDDHNYILTQLKKTQFIRSPELCMGHKRHTMVYLFFFFFHIILNFATLFYRQMLKIHLQLALCLHSECSQPGGGGR